MAKRKGEANPWDSLPPSQYYVTGHHLRSRLRTPHSSILNNSCPGPTRGPYSLGSHDSTTPEVDLGARQQQQRQDDQTPLGNRWDRIDQAVASSLDVGTTGILTPSAGFTLAFRQRQLIARRRAGHSVRCTAYLYDWF